MPCLTRSTGVQGLLLTLEHLDFIFKERPWFLKTRVAFYLKIFFYLKIYFYLLREKFGSHVVNWVKMSICSFTRIVARASSASVSPKHRQHETAETETSLWYIPKHPERNETFHQSLRCFVCMSGTIRRCLSI